MAFERNGAATGRGLRLRARCLRVGVWGSLAAAVVLACVWLGSTGYQVSLVGKPFNRSWHLTGGCFAAEWFGPGANGSVSGFGNTGWKTGARQGFGLRLTPGYTASAQTGYHGVVVPVWPLVLAAGGAWWVMRRWSARVGARLAKLAPPACRGCGYPREGLGEESPCPECGLAKWLRWVRAWGWARASGRVA